MNISRRTFLSGVAAAGTTIFGNGLARSQTDCHSAIPTFKELQQTLEESLPHDSTIPIFYEIDRLVKAYFMIKPTNHVECAIVVWAAISRKPVTHLLEEYCRRIAGISPQLFDHVGLELTGAGLPFTQRILFFREQVYALVYKLTCCKDELTAQRIWLAQLPFHNGEEIGLDDFIDSVSDSYWCHYPESRDVISKIYYHIQESYETSLPYSYCSGIVGESLRLKKQEAQNVY